MSEYYNQEYTDVVEARDNEHLDERVLAAVCLLRTLSPTKLQHALLQSGLAVTKTGVELSLDRLYGK